MTIIDTLEMVSAGNKLAQPLIFSNYSIMPIMLYLPDTQKWVDRYHSGYAHLTSHNIVPHCVAGIHAEKFGIEGTRKYMRDAWTRIRSKYPNGLPNVMPEELKEQYYKGQGSVGGYLSHYMLYNIMSAMKFEHFMVIEDDCRMVDGWREKLTQALKDIPSDFDFLFVGSSDAENKEPVKVSGDLYHFPHRQGKEDYYPQCGHCYIVAKKALPIFIATQRDTAEPVDIGLIFEAFPHLNVYGILPRLANQNGTQLNP
jgi:GR25 family glycosyltransferase involved in LPS biosynthesis